MCLPGRRLAHSEPRWRQIDIEGLRIVYERAGDVDRVQVPEARVADGS